MKLGFYYSLYDLRDCYLLWKSVWFLKIKIVGVINTKEIGHVQIFLFCSLMHLAYTKLKYDISWVSK